MQLIPRTSRGFLSVTAMIIGLLLLSTGAHAAVIAHYQLDGNLTDNLVTGANNGAMSGTETYVEGIYGQAVSLNGSSYVNCGNTGFNPGSSLTVAFWLKWDTSGTTKTWEAMVTKGDQTWRIHREGNTNRVGFHATGLSAGSISSTSDFTDGRWHHVAAVYTGGFMRLYFDGVLEAQAASTGTISTSGEPITIGYNSQGAGREFQGSIDDVLIYSHALDQTQVQELMGGTGIAGRYYSASGPTPNIDSLSQAGMRVDHKITSALITPDPGIGGLGVEGFAARWVGQVYIPVAGDWTFYSNTDDGARVYLTPNGTVQQEIISDWGDSGPDDIASAAYSLQQGLHAIQMDYYENGGGQSVELSWSSPQYPKQSIPAYAYRLSNSDGLYEQFFNNESTTSPIAYSGRTGNIDYSWSSNPLVPNVIADNFSVKWYGKVLTTSTAGNYRFWCAVDDGMEVRVNGILVAQSNPNGFARNGGEEEFPNATYPSPDGYINLAANTKYYLQVRMRENTGGAVARLRWQPPGGTKEIVPISNLVPESNSAPTNISPDVIIVNDNVGDGTVVATLSITDADLPGDAHTYAELSDTCGCLEIVGNEVRVNNAAGLDGRTNPGPHDFQVQVTDLSGTGLTYTETLQVTVLDRTAPTPVLSGNTSLTNSVRTFTVNFGEPVPVFTTDDISVTNGTPSNVRGGSQTYLFDVLGSGAATVQVSIPAAAVTDASGNSNNASNTISYAFDGVAPAGSVTINSGAAGTTSTTVSIGLAVTDTGPGLDVMRFSNTLAGLSGAAWESFSATRTGWSIPSGDGMKTVYAQVRDIAGNIGDFQDSILLDTAGPAMACKNITVQLDNTGSASIVAADIDDGSSDPSGIASLVLDVSSFDCGDAGDVSVTLTGTDTLGQAADCTATVTVADTVAPDVITQNRTVQLSAAGVASVTASDIDNGSSDACGIATRALDVTAFDCGDIGPNTVTLTVTDVHGNSANNTATVTVEDNVAPTVTTRNITAQLDASGSITITPAQVDNGSNDACGIATRTLDVTSFGCGDLGPNTVTLTVTDVNGNGANNTATVTVEDSVAPTVITQNHTVQLDAGGTASITVADIDDGSNDACGVVSRSLSQTTFDCGDVGPNTVTLTVTDVNGNSEDGTATVTVQENEPPSVTTRDITVSLDAAGSATIAAVDVDDGSTDNCGIATRAIDVDNFDCGSLGPNTVTLTVTDVGGNSANDTATVTVVDDLPPVVTPNAGATTSVAIGSTFTDPGATASDNCGVQGGTALPAGTCITGDCGFDTFTPGNSWTIEYSASDVNGNGPATATTVFTVSDDNTAPAFTAVTATPDEAREGDMVTLTFTASEELLSEPEVTINGHAANILTKQRTKASVDYTFVYTVTSDDPEGPAEIVIMGADLAGNIGIETNDSALTILAAANLPVAAWPALMALGLAGLGVLRRRRK